MARYELSHEHAERTTRLLCRLMMDEKLDVVSAMQRINHSEEATAKRLYPISPKRIGAQAFCMEAYRLTTTESPTDPSAEGEQSSEAINPDAYFPVSDEPQNDPSQYYKAYYMKHKAIERHNKSMKKWGDRAHYTQEEHDISETDTTVQESTQGMAPELGEEPAQNSTDKKKKTKNKKTGGGVEKRAKKAIMRMQESPETSGTETTAPKLSEKKKGKKTGGGKEGRVKKAAMRMHENTETSETETMAQRLADKKKGKKTGGGEERRKKKTDRYT